MKCQCDGCGKIADTVEGATHTTESKDANYICGMFKGMEPTDKDSLTVEQKVEPEWEWADTSSQMVRHGDDLMHVSRAFEIVLQELACYKKMNGKQVSLIAKQQQELAEAKSGIAWTKLLKENIDLKEAYLRDTKGFAEAKEKLKIAKSRKQFHLEAQQIGVTKEYEILETNHRILEGELSATKKELAEAKAEVERLKMQLLAAQSLISEPEIIKEQQLQEQLVCSVCGIKIIEGDGLLTHPNYTLLCENWEAIPLSEYKQKKGEKNE